MSSRKRRATTSRAQEQELEPVNIDYDTLQFNSPVAQTRYAENIKNKSILASRNVKLIDGQFDELWTELKRKNWDKKLTKLLENNIDVALVKEF